MELGIGPGRDSAFISDDSRRAAWFANRDELMDDHAGGRPWGWWQYESGLDEAKWPRGTGGEEEVWLRAHGFLTVWEERELKRWSSSSQGAPVTDLIGEEL